MSFNYEIVKELGVLSTDQKGLQKKVRLIKYDKANVPKIDIRTWSEDDEKMYKGITLFEDEARKLATILNEEYDCDDDITDVALFGKIKEHLEMLLGRDPGQCETDDDEVTELYEEAKNLYEAIERLGL